MATGHFITNRGKLLLLQGAWVDNAANTIKMGYVQAIPTAISSAGTFAAAAAIVADFNTVQDLIVTNAATEATFTNYARTSLVSPTATEDDTNDRVNLSATSPWTIASAGGATNNTLYGVFFYDATTDTNDTTRQLLSVDFFASPISTNGGSLSYSWTNIYTAS